MAKINAMMDMGKRSMMNSQTALQTTAHNIASKTTEGYSRQRVEQVTNQPIVEGRLILGMGARAAAVQRINNPYVEKQLQKETGQLGFLSGQSDALARVENIFNEQINKGLNQYLTDFFNAFRELSNNPESISIRTLVKETGEALSSDFLRVNRQFVDVQKDIDTQLIARVDEINKISKEMASLNEKISSIEIQGIPANDMRDRRDYLIKQLNEMIDVRVAEGDQGMITVTTAGNAILVSGYESMDLKTYRDPINDKIQINYQTSPSAPSLLITDRVHGGVIGGILAVRDKILPELTERMDQLAFALAKEVNEAHLEGFDRYGETQNAFFAPLGEVANASKKIAINSDILTDVGRIAAASKPNAPGDNTVANVISMIQYKEIMDGGVSTFDDYYNSQVGKVGILAQRANKSFESQGNIVKQVETLRESISGVSLDEEATKMIEFQKTFDASARVIKTADEMFDTILNLKRL